MNHIPLARAALAALLMLPAVAAQGETKDEPKQDPALPDKLAELKKMARDQHMALDGAAAAQVQALGEAWAKLHPKDQEKVATGIGALFGEGHVRPPGSTALYTAVAAALAKMGEEGAKQLRKALDSERFHDAEYVPLRVQLIEALGKTADLHQVDGLLELARRAPQDEILAAAGGALGNFTNMELPKRRAVVKDLIRRWGELESKGSQLDPVPTPGGAVDFSGQNARKTLTLLRPKWSQTLRNLTGQAHQEFVDWQHWLNKNQDWVPPGGK
jgi:hypothetical protein